MTPVTFRTAVMVLTPDVTVSVFSDGKTNAMHLRAVDTPAYHEIARWAGYGVDWRRYNREHDATHHWLADRLWQPWSLALHDPLDVAIDDAPEPYRREEHCVNRLQRAARTGAPDEHGRLGRLFGGGLDAAIGDLALFLEHMPCPTT